LFSLELAILYPEEIHNGINPVEFVDKNFNHYQYIHRCNQNMENFNLSRDPINFLSIYSFLIEKKLNEYFFTDNLLINNLVK